MKLVYLDNDQKKNSSFPLLAKIINGGIAGMVGVTAVYPLDLVKTRLQTQVPMPDGSLMYTSMFDCFRKVFKTEGFFGMYSGALVKLMLISPEKGIKLAANDFFRHRLEKANGELPLISQMLAGGLAGAFQIVVTTPMELLKIQLQDAGRTSDGANLTNTKLIMDIFRKEGIFGFYKGFGATAIRDVTFSFIYFPLFSYLNSLGELWNKGSQAVTWTSFIAGCGAGGVTAWIVTPIDVVKTRLQLIEEGKGARQYKGIIDCFAKTLSEGPRALFKGGLCRVIVTAPLFGITQYIYFLMLGEKILTFLGLY